MNPETKRLYPPVSFTETEVPEYYKNAYDEFRTITKGLYSDLRIFSKKEKQYLKSLAADIAVSPEDTETCVRVIPNKCHSLISDKNWETIFPRIQFNFVSLRNDRNKIFYSVCTNYLDEVNLNGQYWLSNMFCNPEGDNRDLRVVYSNHAIERIRHRLSLTGMSRHYINNQVFNYTSLITRGFYVRSPHPVDNNDGLIAVYGTCVPTYSMRNLIILCLGVVPELNKNAFLLGYMPFSIHRGFAKSKTFLIPGMRSTPEYIFAKNNITDQFKPLFDALMTDDVESYTNRSDLRMKIEYQHWLHMNGHRQAMFLTEPILKQHPHILQTSGRIEFDD